MIQYLYKDFLEKKEVYILNVAYWERIFNKILKSYEILFKSWLNTTFVDGTQFFDGNPIFHALFENQQKGIRIIQEEPKSDHLEISAWIEETENQEGSTIQELVIVLELSKESELIVKELIKAWVIENLNLEAMQLLIARKISSQPEVTSPLPIFVRVANGKRSNRVVAK